MGYEGLGTSTTSPGAVIACAMLAKPSFEPSVATTWALRIELHPEPARVVPGLRAPQAGYALRRGIAIGARLADGLDEFVDHVLGRGQVRVAHPEIDDVGAGGAGLGLELVDLLEDVRRQSPRVVKVRHCPRPKGSPGRPCAGPGRSVASQFRL